MLPEVYANMSHLRIFASLDTPASLLQQQLPALGPCVFSAGAAPAGRQGRAAAAARVQGRGRGPGRGREDPHAPGAAAPGSGRGRARPAGAACPQVTAVARAAMGTGRPGRGVCFHAHKQFDLQRHGS